MIKTIYYETCQNPECKEKLVRRPMYCSIRCSSRHRRLLNPAPTTIICLRCHKPTPRHGNSQLYCGSKKTKTGCAYLSYREAIGAYQKKWITQSSDGHKGRNREYQRNVRLRNKILAPKLDVIAAQKMMSMPVEQILKNWNKFC